jgi:hypothetical protein
MYGVSVCQVCGVEFSHLFNCITLHFVCNEFAVMEAVRPHALHSLMAKPRLHYGEACIYVDPAGCHYTSPVSA